MELSDLLKKLKEHFNSKHQGLSNQDDESSLWRKQLENFIQDDKITNVDKNESDDLIYLAMYDNSIIVRRALEESSLSVAKVGDIDWRASFFLNIITRVPYTLKVTIAERTNNPMSETGHGIGNPRYQVIQPIYAEPFKMSTTESTSPILAALNSAIGRENKLSKPISQVNTMRNPIIKDTRRVEPWRLGYLESYPQISFTVVDAEKVFEEFHVQKGELYLVELFLGKNTTDKHLTIFEGVIAHGTLSDVFREKTKKNIDKIIRGNPPFQTFILGDSLGRGQARVIIIDVLAAKKTRAKAAMEFFKTGLKNFGETSKGLIIKTRNSLKKIGGEEEMAAIGEKKIEEIRKNIIVDDDDDNGDNDNKVQSGLILGCILRSISMHWENLVHALCNS